MPLWAVKRRVAKTGTNWRKRPVKVSWRVGPWALLYSLVSVFRNPNVLDLTLCSLQLTERVTMKRRRRRLQTRSGRADHQPLPPAARSAGGIESFTYLHAHTHPHCQIMVSFFHFFVFKPFFLFSLALWLSLCLSSIHTVNKGFAPLIVRW